MEAQPDFKELLALFNAHGVEYLVVGAYALAFYGAPRNTGDIGLLVKPDPANAQKILAALTRLDLPRSVFNGRISVRPGWSFNWVCPLCALIF